MLILDAARFYSSDLFQILANALDKTDIIEWNIRISGADPYPKSMLLTYKVQISRG